CQNRCRRPKEPSRRNTRPIPDFVRGRLIRCAAAALVIASALGSDPGRAQDGAPQAQVVIEPGRPAAELNPTGRVVTLTVPVMDGDAYLGDATLTLDTEGRASFSAARLLAL